MPLIPDTSLITGGNHRPSVGSPGMAGLPGKSAARVGEDVQRAAGVLVDVQEKLVRARDNGVKNYARTRIQQAQGEHAQFRIENPDESTWRADMDSRMSKAREEIFKQEMSPFAREELDSTFSGWNQEASDKVAVDVKVQGHSRSRQRGTNAQRAYTQAGDYTSAKTVVKEGVEAGVWLPEEGEAMILDLDDEEREYGKKQTAEKYQFMADEDPRQVIDILKARTKDGMPDSSGDFSNDPEMEAGTRFRLVKYAEGKLEEKKRDEYEAIDQGIIDGKITEAEIENLPVFLDDSDKKKLKARFNRSKPQTETEYLSSWKKMDQLRAAYRDTEVPPTDYLKLYRNARLDILATVPANYDGEFMQSLQYLSPANRQRPGAPENLVVDQKKELELEANEILTGAYEADFFGKSKEGTPEEMDASGRKFRDQKRSAKHWIKQNPNATVDQLREFVDGQLGGQRAGTTAVQLQGFMPGAGRAMLPETKSKGRQQKADASAQLNEGSGGISGDLLPPPPDDDLNQFLNDDFR